MPLSADHYNVDIKGALESAWFHTKNQMSLVKETQFNVSFLGQLFLIRSVYIHTNFMNENLV